MAIPRMRNFARLDVLPSYIVNRLQDALVGLAEGFRVVQAAGADATIEVPAGAGEDAAVIVIDGLPRFNEATVQRAHPGGAAGTYWVFAVAAAQNVVSSPSPNTDNTNYAFDLRIVASGGAPTPSAGVVDVWTRVADVEWDGAKITEVRNLRGEQRSTDPLQPTAPRPNTVALRVRGAASQVADVLRVEDSSGGLLFSAGPAGATLRRSGAGDNVLRAFTGAEPQPRATLTAGGVLNLGDGATAPDVNLYRGGTNILKTDDVLEVAGSSASGALRLSNTATTPAVVIGGDVNLYRSAANVLRTDDAFVSGSLSGASVSATGTGVWIDDGGSVTAKRGAATDPFLVASWTGNTVNPFVIACDGGLSWGGGGGARDVNLYRAEANVLATDDLLRVVGPTGYTAPTRTMQGVELQAGEMNTSSQYTPAVKFMSNDSAFVERPRFGAGIAGRATQTYSVDATGGMAIDFFVTPNSTASVGAAPMAMMSLGNTGILDLAPAQAQAVNAGGFARFTRATAGDAALSLRVTGDAADRLGVDASGKLAWGDGALAPDTNLYRASAGELKSDYRIRAAGGFFADAAHANAALHTVRTAGQLIIRNFLLAADAHPNFQIEGDGDLYWGAGGATAPDTNLYRGAANVLKTDDSLEVGGLISVSQTAGNVVIGNKLLAADANHAFRVLGDGTQQWGAGGAGALDTNLYRGAANQLKTDDGLYINHATGLGINVAPSASALVNLPSGTTVAAGGLLWGTDTNLYRSAADTLRTDDSLHVGATLRHLGSTLGFYNVAPVARPSARTFTNWADGVNSRRILDRNNWELQQLFDYVLTMSNDLRLMGLFQ